MLETYVAPAKGQTLFFINPYTGFFLTPNLGNGASLVFHLCFLFYDFCAGL
jgi:hypothetical protein